MTLEWLSHKLCIRVNGEKNNMRFLKFILIQKVILVELYANEI